MSDYSNITNEELKKHTDHLTYKAEGLRLVILKQCDELSLLYKQLLELRDEDLKRESLNEAK
jgi:hypothetical protein